jgi:type IV fimbrial biogenesis protein FimT
MHPAKSPRREKTMQSNAAHAYVRGFGFTLIDLIITLAIALILFSMVIPSFRLLTVKNLQTSEINRIVRHFHLARSLAISKETHHILCPSRDGENCAEPTDWNHGHILFEDSNENGSRDHNERLEAAYKPLQDAGIGIETTQEDRYVIYHGDGRPSGYNLTLKFCDTENRIPPKAVFVSNLGRVRVSETNWDGSPVICSEEI